MPCEGTGAVEPLLSIAITFLVAIVLGVNAALLHRTAKADGRLVRPLLRRICGRPRARSQSSIEVPPQRRSEKPMNIFSARASWGAEVWEAAAKWIKWDPNATTRAAVQRWVICGDEDAAKK